MAGPVRNAELVANFNNAAWMAQLQLYRMMATASNEDDAEKIKSLSADTTKALGYLDGQFKVLEGLTFNNTRADKDLADLKGSVVDYLKRAASIIDMAESDAGTAMMLMMNAARSFSLIQSTTDDLADSSKDLRDFEIARNELAVDREIMLLATITLIGIVIGCVVSFLIGRGIAKPLTDITNAIKRMAAGNFGTALSGPVAVGADTARPLAQSQCDGEIAIRRKDEVGLLADSFRAMQGQLQEITAQTRVLTDATDEGRLSVRADATGFEGGWRRMIEGLNGLADAYAAPIRMTADYVDRIAKGDIPPKIAETYRGDFNVTKDNLNRCIDAVRRLIDDAQGLVKSAVEGRLNDRADATRHEGEYARIVGGVNRVVDVLVGHLDDMPAPAMVIAPDFTIRYMNDTGSRLLGRPKQALVGSKCYDQFKTSDCHTDKCACARAMRSGSSATSETDAHPNGQRLDIAYTGVPMRDEGGAVIGAFEFVTDLTEIKQAARSTEQAAVLAHKRGAFQAKEIEKLVVSLDKVAKGDLAVALSVEAADEDTAEVAGNFERINAAVQHTVDALQVLIADVDTLAQGGGGRRCSGSGRRGRVTAASTGASSRGSTPPWMPSSPRSTRRQRYWSAWPTTT